MKLRQKGEPVVIADQETYGFSIVASFKRPGANAFDFHRNDVLCIEAPWLLRAPRVYIHVIADRTGLSVNSETFMGTEQWMMVLSLLERFKDEIIRTLAE